MGGVAYRRRLAKDPPGSRSSSDILYVWRRLSPDTIRDPYPARGAL